MFFLLHGRAHWWHRHRCGHTRRDRDPCARDHLALLSGHRPRWARCEHDRQPRRASRRPDGHDDLQRGRGSSTRQARGFAAHRGQIRAISIAESRGGPQASSRTTGRGGSPSSSSQSDAPHTRLGASAARGQAAPFAAQGKTPRCGRAPGLSPRAGLSARGGGAWLAPRPAARPCAGELRWA